MVGAATRSGMVSVVVSATLGSAACGHGTPRDAPDAGGAGSGGDAGDASPPATTIRVHTVGAPALIAFRDGVDAPWQIPVATAVGQYEITVHGPYTVESVCRDLGVAQITQRARTPDDPHDLEMSCLVPATFSNVTGTMVQRGFVALGASRRSSTQDNWPFAITLPEGTYDLVATTGFVDATNPRIVIRRDLQMVAGPTTVIAPIDAASEGVALAALPVTATNPFPQETVDASVQFATRSTPMPWSYDASPATAYVVPDAILHPTDTQFIRVMARTDPDIGPIRWVTRRFSPGVSTEFTLPAQLGPVRYERTGDQLVATWSTLPTYDTLEVLVGGLSTSDLVVFHAVTLSASYVRATGVTSVPVNTDLPGFDAAWRTDYTKEYIRRFDATVNSAEDPAVMDSAFSGLDEHLNAPPPLERHLTRGLRDPGPPGNPAHFQEWAVRELGALLRAAGLNERCHTGPRPRD